MLKNVTENDVLKALSEIDRYGVPRQRQSRKYNLIHQGKSYPPKYVLSLAYKHANGRELEPHEFNGGDQTNSILTALNFEIKEGSLSLKKNLKPQ